ncbi:hypothetical protein [Cryptosporangium aurantiacum]|uniref:Uncharacterized protein n=1 Tax=Cryptosporangium aurantiacum TaxID=134849 RepID=A0A1M7TWD4_9ACTN|nr:hypothetical protein [Cryptosporangium aurantiacum]SHN74990.1 hypothetical protein SAMN05443668_107192 [Cryptosporangium aurantiacum]
MTELRARTPDEAYLFVELLLGREEPVDLHRVTGLVLDTERPVVRVNGLHAGHHHEFDIALPPISHDPVIPGELYGTGRTPSSLIDAGQWRAVELWACSTLDQLLAQVGGRGLDRTAVEDIGYHVDTAYSALAEITKFLPQGAAEVPAEAFWTTDGLAIRGSQPDAFRRERILADEEHYRGMGEELSARQGQLGDAAGPPVEAIGGLARAEIYSSLPQK